MVAARQCRQAAAFAPGALGLFASIRARCARAKHIPAFERHVPPPRKPWMSEDARMGLFDAAALALIFFQKANNMVLPHPKGLLPESRP
jgi:hypothetical protein